MEADMLLILPILLLFVAPVAGLEASAVPRTEKFVVDGVRREALVYKNTRPAPAAGAPLVLFFHGHGGTAALVADRIHFHKAMPEAVVAYLQGLPGVPGITDPQGVENGWQKQLGEVGDRDLHFVDAVLAQLPRRYRIDPNRIYAEGHSNGARFAHLLWDQRPEAFAAFCSFSAQGGLLITGNVPKPIFMGIGENDPIVPAAGQLLSVRLVRRLLQTDSSRATEQGYLRTEPGIGGTELATYIHPGGHEWPAAATPLIVDFFRRHAR
jgi:polyhydroxybutyrate depolymerase